MRTDGRAREPGALPATPAGSRRYEECFGCGRSNPAGLRLRFETVGETVQTEFLPDERHQGYPGLVHGGILYSLLDETMGQAGTLYQTWVMTGRLEIRYLAPVPIGRRLLITSRVTRRRGRAFEISGEARLADGPVVARAAGLFLKIPDELYRQLTTEAD
jgi:acyl-coenzyme A thioesterase PaaI-like protein